MSKNKKKIFMVFGTRPEAIKMAPVYHELKKRKDSLETFLCLTAQHREMLDQVMEIFNMKADVDLNIMTPNQDLFDITLNIIDKLKKILSEQRPDLVLVHGDTTTAMASSIAAFYLHIPVWHIEAGLRTNNLNAPFPEEFNRQAISLIADHHFAPTQQSKINLINEAKKPKQISITGNTVIDALFFALKNIKSNKLKNIEIRDTLSKILGFDVENNKYVLITGHRRENHGDGFKNIFQSFRDLSKKFPDVKFVYPVHMNPKVFNLVEKMLKDLKNFHLIEPQPYENFIYLLNFCYFVITDSGGIQEEAPSLGKPVLVLRELTERPEAVDAGTVELVGTDPSLILKSATELLEDDKKYLSFSKAHNPYGNGKAAKKIILKILNYFEENKEIK